jgi:tetratricopeptide (TPR) repeat protein
MSTGNENTSGYDVFLSHGTPDKPWVRTLRAELMKLGLRAFLDESELEIGENHTLRLSQELRQSHVLALVISAVSLNRPWVDLEWTSFLAEHGPNSDRLIPVLLDPVDLPTFLKPIQGIKAIHRDATRVAAELAALVGRIESLPEEDRRRLFIGLDLVFVLERLDDGRLAVTDPTGRRRELPATWSQDKRFGVSRIMFDRLSREPIESAADRAALHGHAATLGGLLFELLFDDTGRELLRDATLTGRARPLITIRSDDVMLLALPWELIHHDSRFLVRDGVVDLVRTDAQQEVGSLAVLRPPANHFALVVNVSAPENSGLDYENESYRITLALTRHCALTSTELGTLDDLVATVQRAKPTGIHFSGHGSPGRLIFEDDEGGEATVAVGDLVNRLRQDLPEGLLPPFFFLSNCHGNDPAALEKGQATVESLAARLHREGVAQVVAYSGPILDVLATEAEAALYAAIAGGHTTRFAVRQARAALIRPIGTSRSVLHEVDPKRVDAVRESHPFAWSQLVLYHRGPDHPLSQPVPTEGRRAQWDAVLHRTYLDVGTRRILATGFIGRRTELHRLRRKARADHRIFVLQGLGGLGKSTLSIHTVTEILHAGDDLCTLWCQDAEKADRPEGIAEALVGQLLDYCRQRFGRDWEGVVHHVDRIPGAEPAHRFTAFLQVLVEKAGRLFVYLDNLESLLVGPEETDAADPDAFGQWRTPALQAIWQTLTNFARDTDKLTVVASCRYRNDDFGKSLIPVGPLPAGALFRLMGWFPGLRRLSVSCRAQLTGRLDGHPRAVEFANDLVEHVLDRWEEKNGRDWALPAEPTADDLAREWAEIVEPALPQVAEKLRDDLLFEALWDRVLDDRARRMLYRMTLLRRPWDQHLEPELGEPGEPIAEAESTVRRLRRTSLLEQVKLRTAEDMVGHDTIHPATAQFVVRRFGDDPELRRETHRRVGNYYTAGAKVSPYIVENLEAGYHLFQAGDYDRAYDMLGSASDWLRHHGRVREGLQVLEPFLAETVRHAMTPDRVGQSLGSVGLAYHSLGQVQRAISYYEQRLAIAREIGDRRGVATFLGNLGLAFKYVGQVDRAIDYYARTLDIWRAIGDRQGEGNALGNLGIAYTDMGQVDRAIGYYEQALDILHQIGDRVGEGSVLGNLGLAYKDMGQVDRAVGYYVQQLVICREIDDRLGEGNALGNIGIAYKDLGEVDRAIRYFEHALLIAREIDDRQGEGNSMGNLGTAYARLGEVDRAIGYFEHALLIAREIDDRQGEGNSMGNLGAAYARLGEMDRAIGCYEQALRIGQQTKDAQMIKIATAHLERLRGSNPAESPEKG